MKKIIILLPFTIYIAFSKLAEIYAYDQKIIKIAILTSSIICLIILAITFINKIFSYTIIGFTTYCCFLCILFFINPSLMYRMTQSTAFGVFVTMFTLCFISFFTKYPYSTEFGKMIRPASVWSTKAFIKSNFVLTVIWLIISGLCTIVSILPDSYTSDKYRIIFYLFSFLTGIILNFKVVMMYRKKYGEVLKEIKFNFSSVKEMLKTSPSRFNKAASKGENIIYQYHISGSENFDCYVEISKDSCSYHDGIHQKPTCAIFTKADNWKDIYSGKISGVKAYFKGLYKIKGDSSALQKLSMLIPTIKNSEEASSLDGNSVLDPKKYENLSVDKIEKIVVLDGGPRGIAYSKTTMIAQSFCKSMESLGVQADYIFLKDKEIDHCRGCFHCWTKTPGKCIIDDDMLEINKKVKDADILVFATPLYRYGYSSLLKTCLDRMLPQLKPYIIKQNNMMIHPARYENLKKEQGIIIFSCSAFPEIEIFKGLSQSFQLLIDHSTIYKLIAEFYIPAGESLSLPFFADRKTKILSVCSKAAQEIVQKGKISFEEIKSAAEFSYSPESFMERGNSFWELIENKKKYYDVIPKNFN